MISKFFIERPVLANVLAILMVVIGAVALYRLPVAQYPDVVPPTVQVTTRYPGASARTVIDTVALPIEQQVNGVEGMIYMQSYAGADGSYTLTVTFNIGTDLNFAQVLVQNRVSSALSSLPQAVQVQGVNVQKKSTAILQIVTLTSPDDSRDSLYLSQLRHHPPEGRDRAPARRRQRHRVRRRPVFDAGLARSGQDAGARADAPQDVIQALQQQSAQVTAGQIGAPPAPDNQSFQYTLNVLGRLDDAGAVRRRDRQDRQRRRDHAGARHRPGRARRADLRPGLHAGRQAGGGPRDLPGARRQRAQRRRARCATKMKALAAEFPPGVTYDVPFDTTMFVNESIDEVYKTLFEAAILVLIVILVFLQDWRAMLVPATTVPVTIIGAFAAMAAHGLHGQPVDAVRDRAGDRHRGRRRDRRGRRRGAQHREGHERPRRRDPARWTSCSARSSASRWC